MRIAIALLGLAFVSGLGIGQDTADSERRSLDEAVKRFGEAWAVGDVHALDELLAPEYTHTDVTGQVLNRSQWLAYAKTRAGLATGIEFADLQTRMFGNSAIITGANIVRDAGEDFPGAPGRNFQLRFTQVWIKSGGRWRRTAFQATFVQPR
jgi:hypothetical protein